ncbi:hypothetical protein B0O80DRAFT_488243 [Mortierella sp. GBAus27b]|nr:hypothetical protein B0O80DRAFT_488243 [Mortierella sp. GBAus27b]
MAFGSTWVPAHWIQSVAFILSLHTACPTGLNGHTTILYAILILKWTLDTEGRNLKQIRRVTDMDVNRDIQATLTANRDEDGVESNCSLEGITTFTKQFWPNVFTAPRTVGSKHHRHCTNSWRTSPCWVHVIVRSRMAITSFRHIIINIRNEMARACPIPTDTSPIRYVSTLSRLMLSPPRYESAAVSWSSQSMEERGHVYRMHRGLLLQHLHNRRICS